MLPLMSLLHCSSARNSDYFSDERTSFQERNLQENSLSQTTLTTRVGTGLARTGTNTGTPRDKREFPTRGGSGRGCPTPDCRLPGAEPAWSAFCSAAARTLSLNRAAARPRAPAGEGLARPRGSRRGKEEKRGSLRPGFPRILLLEYTRLASSTAPARIACHVTGIGRMRRVPSTCHWVCDHWV